MKWLDITVKVAYQRKDVAVSVNKESLNKNSSKNYFSGFSFTLHCIF